MLYLSILFTLFASQAQAINMVMDPLVELAQIKEKIERDDYGAVVHCSDGQSAGVLKMGLSSKKAARARLAEAEFPTARTLAVSPRLGCVMQDESILCTEIGGGLEGMTADGDIISVQFNQGRSAVTAVYMLKGGGGHGLSACQIEM